MTLPIPGIDIAKLKFNACLINPSGNFRLKVFPNTAAERRATQGVADAAERRATSCLHGSHRHVWRGARPRLESLVEMRVMEENRLS